jgi:hypothetical protein
MLSISVEFLVDVSTVSENRNPMRDEIAPAKTQRQTSGTKPRIASLEVNFTNVTVWLQKRVLTPYPFLYRVEASNR